MKKFTIGISSLIVILVVIIAVAMIPWKNINHHQKPIQAVTGMDFYGEVAQQVAGNHGKVTSFINNPSVDPHDYQPGTKQAQELGQANVIIENGVGYDSWMNKLVKSNGNSKARVVNVSHLVGKKDGDNEHLWYQPATVKKLALDLATQFGKVDPEHKADYQKNAQRYLASLKPLDREIARVKRQVNPSNNQVAVSEPVFDYALSNLGYQVMDQHFEKAVEDGSDPSPKDINEIQQAIKNHQIAFFVNNSQASNSVVKNLVKLAHQNNVPVLNVTETKPKGKTYTQWMTDQYKALAKIQQAEQN